LKDSELCFLLKDSSTKWEKVRDAYMPL